MPLPRLGQTACPCGTGKPYSACCHPLHVGTSHATTAEELMRSRYAGYATGAAAYLTRTWHPRTRPANVDAEQDVTWTGLAILDVVDGGPDDDEGQVQFRARFTDDDGNDHELVERSTFTRRGGRWVYVDAIE